ncbi:hypothetical protein [Microlunatus sp. Y2014]|uniref:hypothetical protein n=1 Tax=Microlunatus sp. Y2014 TaxID=3418488 RepID=UPI003DA755C5
MATKRYDPSETGFDARYARWVSALESGADAELDDATAELPTLDKRVLAKLAAVDWDEPDPEARAVQKRLIVLVSEVNANRAVRLRERKQAAQRRRDRTVRVERRVELPTTCARCGAKLKDVKSTGRPRLYCSPACRKAAYEDRRAHRDGAVKVQVVEKIVTEVRERRIKVPHPRSDCIDSVLADDDAMLAVIWTLTALVRDRSRRAYDPGQPRFKSLSHHAAALHDELRERRQADQSSGSAP